MDKTFAILSDKDDVHPFFQESYCRNFKSGIFFIQLREIIQDSKCNYLVVTQKEINSHFISAIQSLIKDNFDIIHGNSNFILLKFLNVISPGYLFNIKPNIRTQFVSWQINIFSCILNLQTVKTLFSNLPRYKSSKWAGFDAGYKGILHGYMVKYHNLLESPMDSHKNDDSEEHNFVTYNFKNVWRVYLFLFYFIYFKKSSFKYILNKKYYPSKPAVVDRPYLTPSISTTPDISALIPSLNREKYLLSLLNQLDAQTIKPNTVYIVDQSDKMYSIAKNQYSFTINHIYTKKCGQSSARNIVLNKIQSKFLLLLDDDIDIHSDFLESHLKCIAYFNADYSIGPIFENRTDFNSPPNNGFRVADLFPGGNTLLRIRSWPFNIRFDEKFNFGPRADFDFGVQLYKEGYIGVFNPNSPVYHYRANLGGLRHYKARAITLESSKKNIFQFNIPHSTEFYLIRKYGPNFSLVSYFLIRFLGIFRYSGSFPLKCFKCIFGLILSPYFLKKIYSNFKLIQ